MSTLGLRGIDKANRRAVWLVAVGVSDMIKKNRIAARIDQIPALRIGSRFSNSVARRTL